MTALVVANGDIPSRAALDDAWPGWDASVSLVIAADGGALGARRLGFEPSLVIGDADSLSAAQLAALRRRGIEVLVFPAAKDASDTELALRAALQRGAQRIVVLGALGGERFDHSLANVALLALESLAGRDVELLEASTRVTLLRSARTAGRARALLVGRPGDRVSLFPFGGVAHGIVTEGLAYPLRDETLPLGTSRGLSNVRLRCDAAVELRRGSLIVVETTGAGLRSATGADASTPAVPTAARRSR